MLSLFEHRLRSINCQSLKLEESIASAWILLKYTGRLLQPQKSDKVYLQCS